jgi:hypothetical protein
LFQTANDPAKQRLIVEKTALENEISQMIDALSTLQKDVANSSSAGLPLVISDNTKYVVSEINSAIETNTVFALLLLLQRRYEHYFF